MSLASGAPGILTGPDASAGMARIAVQAARPPESAGGTLKRHCTASGILPSAVSALLKPLTAATKTLTGSEAGEHVGMDEFGK
ncbi:MAG: hypothetical protein OXH79_06200 [Boseongicola sp.]|nr:hypothetical protein [Boseongicola sp.]